MTHEKDERFPLLRKRLKDRTRARQLSLCLRTTMAVMTEPAFVARAAGFDALHVDLEPSTASLTDAGRLCATATPLGRRAGYGPVLLLDYQAVPLAEQADVLNGAVPLGVMLESGRAVAAAGEMAAVPGIDLLLVGIPDLTADLGIPGALDDPAVAAAYQQVAAAAASGKAFGVAGVAEPEVPAEGGARLRRGRGGGRADHRVEPAGAAGCLLRAAGAGRRLPSQPVRHAAGYPGELAGRACSDRPGGAGAPCLEVAAAQAAAAGVVSTLSSSSAWSLEDVARSCTGPMWFQLYIWRGRELTRRVVERAPAEGFRVLRHRRRPGRGAPSARPAQCVHRAPEAVGHRLTMGNFTSADLGARARLRMLDVVNELSTPASSGPTSPG